MNRNYLAGDGNGRKRANVGSKPSSSQKSHGGFLTAAKRLRQAREQGLTNSVFAEIIRLAASLVGLGSEDVRSLIADNVDCLRCFELFVAPRPANVRRVSALVMAYVSLDAKIALDDSAGRDDEHPDWSTRILLSNPEINSFLPSLINYAGFRQIRVILFQRLNHSSNLSVKGLFNEVRTNSFVYHRTQGLPSVLESISRILESVYSDAFGAVSSENRVVSSTRHELNEFGRDLDSISFATTNLIPFAKANLSRFGLDDPKTPSVSARRFLAKSVSTLIKIPGCTRVLRQLLAEWTSTLDKAMRSAHSFRIRASEKRFATEISYWKRMNVLCEFYFEQLVSFETRCVVHSLRMLEPSKLIDRWSTLESRFLQWTTESRANLRGITLLGNLISKDLGNRSISGELDASVSRIGASIRELCGSSHFYGRPDNAYNLIFRVNSELAVNLREHVYWSSKQSDRDFSLRLQKVQQTCKKLSDEIGPNKLKLRSKSRTEVSALQTALNPISELGNQCELTEKLFRRALNCLALGDRNFAVNHRGYELVRYVVRVIRTNTSRVMEDTETLRCLVSTFEQAEKEINYQVGKCLESDVQTSTTTKSQSPEQLIELIVGVKKLGIAESEPSIARSWDLAVKYFENHLDQLKKRYESSFRDPPGTIGSPLIASSILWIRQNRIYLRRLYDRLRESCPAEVLESSDIGSRVESVLGIYDTHEKQIVNHFRSKIKNLPKLLVSPIFTYISNNNNHHGHNQVLGVNMDDSLIAVRECLLELASNNYPIEEELRDFLRKSHVVNRNYVLAREIVARRNRLFARVAHSDLLRLSMQGALETLIGKMVKIGLQHSWVSTRAQPDLNECLAEIKRIEESVEHVKHLLAAQITPHLKTIEQMVLVHSPLKGALTYDLVESFYYHLTIKSAERLSLIVQSFKYHICSLLVYLVEIASQKAPPVNMNYDQIWGIVRTGGSIYQNHPNLNSIVRNTITKANNLLKNSVSAVIEKGLKAFETCLVPQIDVDYLNAEMSFTRATCAPMFKIHLVLDGQTNKPSFVPSRNDLEKILLKCVCYIADIGRVFQQDFPVRPQLIHSNTLKLDRFLEKNAGKDIRMSDVNDLEVPFGISQFVRLWNVGRAFVWSRETHLEDYIEQFSDLKLLITEQYFDPLLSSLEKDQFAHSEMLELIRKLLAKADSLDQCRFEPKQILPFLVDSAPFTDEIARMFRLRLKSVGELLLRIAGRNINEIRNFVEAVRSRLPAEFGQDGMMNVLQIKAVINLNRQIEQIAGFLRSSIQFLAQIVDELRLIGVVVEQDLSDNVSRLSFDFDTVHQALKSLHQQIFEFRLVYASAAEERSILMNQEINLFLDDFFANGPLVLGISAQEAKDRMFLYQTMFEVLWQKYARCYENDILLGLKITVNKKILQVRQEFERLDQLYGLYDQCVELDSRIRLTPWKSVDTNALFDEVSELSARSKKLVKKLKTWPAYTELMIIIKDLLERIPLLGMMVSDAMQERHWKSLKEILGREFNPEDESFFVGDMLEMPMMEQKELVEDVCITAYKEKEISNKLQMIDEEWKRREFVLAAFKAKGDILLKGQETSDILAAIEESNLILAGLASNRYNQYFQDLINKLVGNLFLAQEVISKWIQVQNLYTYLEAVFIGGDIAKQLPVEARKFVSVDRTWHKMINRIKETPNVVACCISYDNNLELLNTMLDQLEVCQNSLTGYLETKRKIFPRFYFLSEPVLLEILGQASDPRKLQPYFSSFTESVSEVEYRVESDGAGEIDQTISKLVVSSMKSSENEELTLVKTVNTLQQVEEWLGDFLSVHQKTVQHKITDCLKQLGRPNFDLISFFDQTYQQFALIVLQLVWTANAESAITAAQSTAMEKANKFFKWILKNLILQTVRDLSAYNRQKFETLITVHINQRDAFNELTEKSLVSSVRDFDWQRQCRFYYSDQRSQMRVEITDISFDYSHEFLACGERLVITPLTDRCYISLAQALGMCYGGSPAGPAGTGKTETTKDMARAIGKYCVVLNCSDQFDYKGLGKTYKGLAQSGCWGCFDEFNRINLPVLSVAAQQIQTMLQAKRDGAKKFTFTDGDQIGLDRSFAVIITMNPGYAGRQELPENLKVNFRVVAMMVPDRQIIIRVKLASSGFAENVELSQKFYLLYKLCEDQLSKQVHYDFGLRNILAVLRTLGTARRGGLHESESRLVLRVLRDMNLSKLVDEDEPLFMSLLNDLFPSVELAKESNAKLQAAIAHVVDEMKLVNVGSWNLKVVQLYETQLVRHGIMVLGPSGSGKTKCIEVLEGALSVMGTKTREYRMNPKAITATQMFGALDVATNDWTDGIFSTLWRRFLRFYEAGQKSGRKESIWMVLDGPVDAVWIENLNSVLDDNKLLTLANGDRIPMAGNVKVLFEVHNIDNASPATVSRNGMVFMSSSVLPWTALVESWARKRKGEVGRVVWSFMRKVFDVIVKFCQNELEPKVAVGECNYARQALDILDGLPLSAFEADSRVLERFVVFALTWSFGALLDLPDRNRLESFCRSKFAGSEMSWGGGLFGYFVDDDGQWAPWSDRVSEWKYPEDDEEVEYSRILVPNVDNVRTIYLMGLIAGQGKNVLLTGEQGTAKTVMTLSFLDTSYDPEQHSYRVFNFSSATTPGFIQRTIEGFLEKRIDGSFACSGDRSMTVFIDDISMPMVNEWGDQIANEIVRQLIEYKGFYSLDRPGDWTAVHGLRFLAAMVHPSGGRNDIPERLKRHFSIFNCSLPSDEAIDKIFGAIANYFCRERDFSREVVEAIPAVVEATRVLWQGIKLKMLPTPAKFHYVFNLRDLSRIWEGMLHVRSGQCSGLVDLVLLWKHECSRVLRDRLIEFGELEWYDDLANEQAVSLVSSDEMVDVVVVEEEAEELTDGGGDDEKLFVEQEGIEKVVSDREKVVDSPLFCNFLRIDDDVQETFTFQTDQDSNQNVYERVLDVEKLSTILDQSMVRMNAEIRGNNMDLVFFHDAIEHILRISRILNTNKGHALLIGVGGSGKQSLSKLAAYINQIKVFRIQVSRTYNISAFLEDMRVLYKLAIKSENGVAFILSDNDIVDEQMLEYLNDVLNTGEIAGLFSREEYEPMLNELSFALKRAQPKLVQTREVLMSYFRARIRRNLHVVLCFSPDNKKFRERAMKFPGIISGCTIDWFHRWPLEALISVSAKYLERHELQCEDSVKLALISLVGQVHDDIRDRCQKYFDRTRRRVHVTPKTYLSFLASYIRFYEDKKAHYEGERIKMVTGIEKLSEAKDQVNVISQELALKEKDIRVVNEKAGVELKKTEGIKEQVEKKAEQVGVIKEEAELLLSVISTAKVKVDKEMDAANEVLQESKKALQDITANDIEYLRKLNHPPGLIMIIVDSILPMLKYKMDKITFNMNVGSKLPPFYNPNTVQIRRMLGRSQLVKILYELNPDNLNDEMIELMNAYFNYVGYTYAKATSVFKNLAPLVNWSKKMEEYYYINKSVTPLKTNVFMMQSQHDKASRRLEEAAAQYAKVDALLQNCLVDFNKAMAEKQKIQDVFDALQAKRDRAASLVDGLTGERKRWNAQSLDFAKNIKKLVGDSILATAFLSYSGAFEQDERETILRDWISKIREFEIPSSDNFDLVNSLIDEATVDEWNLEGLPADQLSTGNGIIITQASRYPLLIDPQVQGKRWLKKHFPDLVVTTLDSKRLRVELENCLSNGNELLIEDIGEELDPIFDNILDKNYFKLGTKLKCMVGDRDVDIHPDFKLFFTTKLSNPNLSPEVSARCTVVDFAVTMQGLEEQLLALTISHEKASLENERIKIAFQTSRNKRRLKDLEEGLLAKLSSIEGSVIEDEELVRVLNTNREISAQIKDKMIVAAKTKERLLTMREQYRLIAIRGSILYFSITQMSAVNAMYQTSLEQFLVLFKRSLSSPEADAAVEEAPDPKIETDDRKSARQSLKIKKDAIDQIVGQIVDRLTLTVWSYVSRSLYRADRSTFTLLLALQIAIRDGSISRDEFMTLVKGGAMLDLKSCPPRSADWIEDTVWLNLVQLSFLPRFKIILNQISVFPDQWKAWKSSPSPENLELPGDMSSATDSFQRLLVVRCMCPDRTLTAAQYFIGDVLGTVYSQPYLFDMRTMLRDEGTISTPLMGLLTSGSDPTNDIKALAREFGRSCRVVSMGQGQAERARLDLDLCRREGHWLILQNCHLGLDYMLELGPALIIDTDQVHEDFRIWLTTEIHPDFPIQILQSCTKFTSEPPQGIRAGLLRTLGSFISPISKKHPTEHGALIYSLSFLHSILQERRKYGPLGWNIPYEFSQTDFEATAKYISSGLAANRELSVDWKAIRYMVGEIQYGGRVTDDHDRRLLQAYTRKWVGQHVFDSSFSFGPGGANRIPENCHDVRALRHHVENAMPRIDSAKLFGLHPNADITYQARRAKHALATIMNIQPKDSSGGGGDTRESVVYRIAKDILGKFPKYFVDRSVRNQLANMGRLQPMSIFLRQEVNRMQKLLVLVKSSLVDLLGAIDGFVIMTNELRDILDNLYDGRVPQHWVRFSWSSTALGFWLTELNQRYSQLSQWLNSGAPRAFWFAGFFNPAGFVTAMRQEITRRHSDWALDFVAVESRILTIFQDQLTSSPNEGVYIYGLYIEGAAWDVSKQRLCEASPKVLFSRMPVIHLFAVNNKKIEESEVGKNKLKKLDQSLPASKKVFDVTRKSPFSQEHYECPVYRKVERTGANYITSLLLPTDKPVDHWIIRGVALFCDIN